jgi:hypothetical protein
MSKTVIIVMAAPDNPEGHGRMIHAAQAAKELNAAGQDVKIVFEGIGVSWLDSFHRCGDLVAKAHGLVFEEFEGMVAGACNFCATKRFNVGDAVKALGLPLLGPDGGHYSLGEYAAAGYQVITF